MCVLGVEGICREIDFGLLNIVVEDCWGKYLVLLDGFGWESWILFWVGRFL